ncbi:MAG TPA: SRPBCC family protein [Planococcus sp. (in: firmicutes)]|nr:SRPBCC family protein [Planococcus sp. (in: firmicutes)]
MAHTKQTIFINAPLENVFRYTINPENWAHFYNNLSSPKKIDGTGDLGTVVETDYAIMGLHFPVTIQVTECEVTDRTAKWTGMVSGSLNARHSSYYEAKDLGTELTFEIESYIPDDLFGKITDRLIYERMDRKSAAHSLENVKMICENPE